MARGARLVGVDVARCLALLGMMATHVLLETDPDGTISSSQWLAGGRASALFAMLAGVSMALMTGGREPVAGRERRARRAGLAVRAAMVAFLGLMLGELDTGIAVILTYYGVLFLLGLPFVGLRAPTLLALGLGWVVAGPVLNTLVRSQLPTRGTHSPAFDQLTDPGQLISELLFSGYYPAFVWLAYLLVGLGIGRLDLRSRRVQAVLVAAGGATAVAATWVSHQLTALPRVGAALLVDLPAYDSVDELMTEIQYGMFGTTPRDGSWAWMLVVAPHSSTPFDVAQTLGSAALVLGLCLGMVSLAQAGPGEAGVRFVQVLFGAGAMTLTLYTLHVVMRAPDVWPAETPSSYVWHVLIVLGVGAAYAAAHRKGPLEQVVASVSDAAARSVRADRPA